ncbi:hypothetical protein EVAR_77578_1 [Eumeta japonica]|uniref:Uncharacterized protein n=1 Tax=Eumeta variegata TaxID=151549 RepID=A0A4C1T6Q5_EUMVA|nr:hypothetical protein EVAR_77578_1 [Eumeta japonica]
MKARYYICVGGKWMRVRLRVDGPVLVGQRARPVFLVRCGTKLCALPPVEVSRELGAHAAGAPSRARSGPTLSLLRHVRRRHQCSGHEGVGCRGACGCRRPSERFEARAPNGRRKRYESRIRRQRVVATRVPGIRRG